jgi:hypothetical protein
MDEQEFVAGHVFYQHGDVGDVAYLLQEGSVELLAGAKEPLTRVGLCMAGDVFGEMALVEERPREFTARAVTAGRTRSMSRDAFEHHLLHDPARIRQYLRSLFERLRSLTARLGNELESASVGSPSTAGLTVDPESSALRDDLVAQGTSAGWTLIINPLTRKAAETLPDDGLLVTRFPLRIGRAASAREGEAMDLNDLWLLDDAPYNISRNHCEIDVAGDGPIVRDRGSHLGCFVNDVRIGGPAAMSQIGLDAGDNVVVIGSRMSPYQFRVTVNPCS